MAFLADIGKAKLRHVPAEDLRDRSAANVALSGADVLEDEAERWKYFFDAGCRGWMDALAGHTFRSTFVDLPREDAAAIVDHWEARLQARQAGDVEREAALLEAATASLQGLRGRLDDAVRVESEASPAGRAFVKLSTRSPKDSGKALERAAAAYRARLEKEESPPDDNRRWKILSEEVTQAGAVATGADALELLLDSERVYEDLEYALRGPKTHRDGAGAGAAQAYDMSVVARAWDPRLTLSSEFRGIAWGGGLTCLCQYFHPLFFPELLDLKETIEKDCLSLFAQPAVSSAVAALGGNCIVDFAWLGQGDVIIVELNPFDGLCLGTFPASTGLFLWDDARDQAVMKGEALFETRIRSAPLAAPQLKAQCSPHWRRIIYEETEIGR
mmetsp:Transcript_21909/g.62143  ORF Transcript_21909/g.62143 Transcript_21909/m.62143 type:complete len:387 (-) Transcript_21909:159-1319(-)